MTHPMDVQTVTGRMAALIDAGRCENAGVSTIRPCEGQCTPSAIVPLRVARYSHWRGFPPRSVEATWIREFRCINVLAKSICTTVDRRQ